MKLYHATTQKKAKQYRQSGAILAPVRGFTTMQAAMAYNRFAAKEFREFACYNRFDVCPVLKRMQDACRPAHG